MKNRKKGGGFEVLKIFRSSSQSPEDSKPSEKKNLDHLAEVSRDKKKKRSKSTSRKWPNPGVTGDDPKTLRIPRRIGEIRRDAQGGGIRLKTDKRRGHSDSGKVESSRSLKTRRKEKVQKRNKYD